MRETGLVAKGQLYTWHGEHRARCCPVALPHPHCSPIPKGIYLPVTTRARGGVGTLFSCSGLQGSSGQLRTHGQKKNRPAISFWTVLLYAFRQSRLTPTAMAQPPPGRYTKGGGHPEVASAQAPPALCPHSMAVFTGYLHPHTGQRKERRTRGGLSEAHLPPVCTKLWFEVVHLTVLRANSYSQMVIHNCRWGRTEASV